MSKDNNKVVDLEFENEIDVPEEVPEVPAKVEKKKKVKKPNVFVRAGRKVKAGYYAVKESPAAALIGAGLTAAAAGVAYGVKLIVSAKRNKADEDDISESEPIEIQDSGEEYLDDVGPTEDDESLDEAV